MALNETAIDIAACRTCGFGSARNASTSRLAGTDMTVERRIIELPRGDVYGSRYEALREPAATLGSKSIKEKFLRVSMSDG